MQTAEVRCNVLVCTLGVTWAVVPEAYSFVAPHRLDLYSQHPQSQALEAARRAHGLEAPDELWVVTTGGARAGESLKQLQRWWELAGRPVALRVWQAWGTDQLVSLDECERLRELILRAVLGAKAHSSGGQVLLSLAGGRKTMSADLQTAGALFGAHAWLHVVGPDGQSSTAGALTPEMLASALPADIAGQVTPLVVGRGVEDETMQVPLDGRRVDVATFSLPLPDSGKLLLWSRYEGEPALCAEVDRRQREGSQLLGNFLAAVASQDQRENWRSLYRLPPALIETLRTTTVASHHEAFLRALPKADLHRHLGGAIGLEAQREVGLALWDLLSPAERDKAAQQVASLLDSDMSWPWDWPMRLRGPGRAAATAAVLAHASGWQLQRALFGDTEPRVALKRSVRGFAAYERPGELSGSALLSHPAAVESYAQHLVAQAQAEGLAYVEIRGSPQKYRPENPAGFVDDLAQALSRAGARVSGCDDGIGPRSAFLWILDRRVTGGASATIDAAVKARARWGDFLVGVDLAGDEDSSAPSDWEPLFGPVFRECLAVTIHAGEDAPAENIWQAAYLLHADRIGHGLSLHEHPRLMARFRDRRICLELCHTSNVEVVGYLDPLVPETAGLARYPLRTFIDQGVPVTLCTDNPGISRTTLAAEYLTASRMTEGGLTLWEALALIRQGFTSSFLPGAARDALLLDADIAVRRAVLESFGG